MFYSKSSNGFYDQNIHGDKIPGDSVKITKELYHILLDGQSQGKMIAIEDSGTPILVDRPKQSIEDWRETESISSRQGEQQLIISGLDEQVEAAIGGISDATERKLTRSWYQRATVWERNNPQLIALGEALGLTDEQIDDLFKQASEL